VSTHYMDEAERCDRIAYLANGRKIAEGRVEDILARSSLITFRGEGADVRRLSEALKGKPGLDHVAYFGAALHVSGKDRAKLQAGLASVGASDVVWQEVRPSLEDAFIALMSEAGADTRVHA